jgi:hypothetical protein
MWANLLHVSYYLLGIGLGGGVLLALFSVTGARWSTLIEPVAAKLTYLLPVGAAGAAIVLVAHPTLYPWARLDWQGDVDSSFQSLWLSRPFFLLRSLAYLALWLVMTFQLVRVAQKSGWHAGKAVARSAAFLVVFALTCWLSSVDWIMSLEPRWSSTIFGVYHFSGMFLGVLAAVIVLALWFDHRGLLGGRLSRDHLRDLGTLLFSFSSFWMYIWFSQYLLIWYVNNPEETEYFILRQSEVWQPVFFANLILNWAVPFLVLLFRRAKESPTILLIVALCLLAGRWLDLYLMILPPVAGTSSAFGPWDLSLIPGAVGLALLLLDQTPATQTRRPSEGLASS